MKKANLIKIANKTKINLILWPKRLSYRDQLAIFVGANTFKMIDLVHEDTFMDLDRYYFQFDKDKKKICIDEIEQYGVIVEYEYFERKGACDHYVSTKRGTARAT